MAPVWFAEIVVFDVLHDLSEVVLGSIPAANPVISSKITFDFKAISRRGIPLKKKQKYKTLDKICSSLTFGIVF